MRRMSSLLGMALSLLHQADKLVEQIAAVLRTGRGFGMILDSEDAVSHAFHTLYGVI